MTAGGNQDRGLLVCGRFPELEDALCERVAELRRGRPLAPLTIVVGSTAVRTRVGDLLVRRLHAVANISVVTLSRFARDLVARADQAPPPVLAALGRERILRRLVAARASSGALAYFSPVAERPHFARALRASFDDLRQALVSPDAVWPQAAGSGAAGAETSQARARDLRTLYAAYCAELERRGVGDEAAVLVAAAHCLRRASGGASEKTILYGIYDLNRAQESLVGVLLAAGADLLAPVPRGGEASGVTALQVGTAAGRVCEAREAPAAAGDLDALAALWRPGGAARRDSVELRGDGSLEILSVPHERAECHEAVRAVLGAVAQGAALWDCAVVTPHGDDVEPLAVALEAAGLPVACRRPDQTAGARVIKRLAECLAPPAGEPFARRAVLDLFCAAPLLAGTATARESALWLDEARQAGVVGGLAQWTERLARRRRGLEHRLSRLEVAGEAPELDDEENENLRTVRLRLAATGSLEAAAGALARACRALPARASWDEWAGVLRTLVADLFEPAAAVAAGEVADRLLTLAVLDEQVDVAEMAAVLRELVDDGGVVEGRVGRDGVAVLTPMRLRGLGFHSVVFTGLAEGGFPSRGLPDPVLGDAERKRLAEALGTRLPLAEQRDAESLLLFALACEAAREKLTLLAPRTDAASGRPRLPSRLLLRLAALAAGRPVGLEEFLTGAPLAPVWRHVGGAPDFDGASELDGDGAVVWVDARERDTAALLALSARRGDAAHGYLAAVLEAPGSAERRLGAWRSARSPEAGAWDGLLGGEARAALAARHPFAAEMHPTRLERYVVCPFAFYLRDLLGLDAPEEPGESLEMDNREFGTLAHDILQRGYQAVMAGGLGLDAAGDAVTAAWRVCCAEAEARGVTGAELSWRVRRQLLLEDLLESVSRDPVFRRAGERPAAVEWRFGEAAGRPVALELEGGRRIRFAGRLDRVDVTLHGARIVDYKTGAGATERKRVKDGLSVQLPVYQLAVRQAGDEDIGGVGSGDITCLYRLVTRRGGFEDLRLPESEEAAAARLRDLVAGAAGLIDDGMFPRTSAGRCDYCDLSYACGVSLWTRARKRGGEALGDVVDLQKGDLTGGGGDDA